MLCTHVIFGQNTVDLEMVEPDFALVRVEHLPREERHVRPNRRAHLQRGVDGHRSEGLAPREGLRGHPRVEGAEGRGLLRRRGRRSPVKRPLLRRGLPRVSVVLPPQNFRTFRSWGRGRCNVHWWCPIAISISAGHWKVFGRRGSDDEFGGRRPFSRCRRPIGFLGERVEPRPGPPPLQPPIPPRDRLCRRRWWSWSGRTPLSSPVLLPWRHVQVFLLGLFHQLPKLDIFFEFWCSSDFVQVWWSASFHPSSSEGRIVRWRRWSREWLQNYVEFSGN